MAFSAIEQANRIQKSFPENFSPTEMSHQSRQRQKIAERHGKVSKRRARISEALSSDKATRRWLLRLAVGWSLLAALTFVLTWNLHLGKPQRPSSEEFSNFKPFKPPTTLAELMSLPSWQLDRCDIAVMNLLCAEGLPGAQNMNVAQMVRTLDRWATEVYLVTERNFHQFRESPQDFENSETYFRMLCLVTVLEKEFSVHYNPALMDPFVPGDVFFGDSRHTFINGLIGPERMGTCSSMPVLYVAVARRLGYPLSLAMTKQHFFAQWNDKNEHFNVECTTWGFTAHDDDFYKRFPVPLTYDDLKQNRYLRPLTGAEELSQFLEIRGVILAGFCHDYSSAVPCFQRAHQLTPSWSEATTALNRSLTDLVLSNPNAQFDEIQRECRAQVPSNGNGLPVPIGVIQAPPPADVTQLSQPQAAPDPFQNSRPMVSGSPAVALPNGRGPATMQPAFPNSMPQQPAWPSPRPIP